METQRKHMHLTTRAKKLLRVVVPTVVVLAVVLLLWRPWFTRTAALKPGPWIRIRYTHAEIQNYQQWADKGAADYQCLLDPEKALRKFMTMDDPDGSFDLRGTYQDLRLGSLQSLGDLGKDPENGDRLFLASFSSRPDTVVVFRLRQLGRQGTGNVWSVIGYLITPKATPAATYSTTWRPSDDPFLDGQ